jgi:TRAP-type C4-dicarboxylate transport system substrate-binding protein
VLGARGCLMGVKSYNKLPEDLQKIMKEACLEGEKYYNEIILQAKAEHTEKLLKGGAKIIAIDNTAFQDKMLSIADKLEDAGYWRKGLFKEVMALK